MTPSTLTTVAIAAAGAEEKTRNSAEPAYLEPNSHSMQKPVNYQFKLYIEGV